MSGFGRSQLGGLPPAGWYEDPTCPSVVRYWDGAAWSSDQVCTALVGSAPKPAASTQESWGSVTTQHRGGADERLTSSVANPGDRPGYRIIEAPSPAGPP